MIQSKPKLLGATSPPCRRLQNVSSLLTQNRCQDVEQPQEEARDDQYMIEQSNAADKKTANDQEMKKILIIGAGPKGMISARHLSEAKNHHVTVIDANSEVGGLWVYSDITEFHPDKEEIKKRDNYYKLYNCFQSSLYSLLVSNIPHMLMTFKDFNHLDSDPTLSPFITLAQHKKYLDAYWDHFGLRKYVKLNTLVKCVKLFDNLDKEKQLAIKEPRKFVVTTVDSKGESFSQNEKVETFDYVIGCSGQHSKPYTPSLKGIDNFKGIAHHCKDFRNPDHEFYNEKVVLVVGGNYSAIDLVLQFFHNPFKGRQKIKKMVVCANHMQMFEKTADFRKLIDEGSLVLKKCWFKDFTATEAVFTDGSKETIDTIIYCTGYEVVVPYLDPADKILEFGGEKDRGKYVGPLYKKFISIREPNFFLPGICDLSPICNFLGELQAIMTKQIIEGTLKLPSKIEMLKAFEEDIQDARKRSASGTLESFFRYRGFENDIEYLQDLRKILIPAYPENVKKSDYFYERFLNMTRIGAFYFDDGNLLRYRAYDYYQDYPKDLRNTSDFL